MLETITLNLGPLLGFLCTIATVVFIAWGAPRTYREGGLEALQEGVFQPEPAEPASAPPPAAPSEDGGETPAAASDGTPRGVSPEA